MKAFTFLIVFILAFSLALSARPARAQAYNATFTSAVIYQNPSLSAANRVQLVYYPTPASKTPITIPYPDIPEGKTVSVYIGTLDQASEGFHGTTYVQSATKLVSIQVQTAQPPSSIRVHPITNLPPYGSPVVWIPTILRNENTANSILYIQNVDAQTNLVQINLLDLHGLPVYVTHMVLEPGETFILDTNQIQDPLWPEKFNGSGYLTATLLDGNTPGNITASVLELDTTFLGARAFVGLGHGKQQVYMPTAACNYDIGAGVLVNSAYAIQNTDLHSPTNITITYTNGLTRTQTIQPGAKISVVTCKVQNMPNNFLGAATIRSTPAQIIALGKVYGAGLSTAFTGALADSGTRTLALPYVRWVDDAHWYEGTQQRTFIAVQNIGTEAVTSLQAFFYPCHGDKVLYNVPLKSGGLRPGEKVSLSPGDVIGNHFSTCGNSPRMGGSALIVGPENSHLTAVVRVQQWDPAHNIVVGDDYNAINLP